MVTAEKTSPAEDAAKVNPAEAAPATVKPQEAGAVPVVAAKPDPKPAPKPAPRAASKAPAKAVKVVPVAAKAAAAKPVVQAAVKVPAKPAQVPVKPVKPIVKAAPKAEVKAPVAALAKTPEKTSAKGLVKAVAKVKTKVEKQAKEKKPKLVRDSFTIPKAEYTVLDDLKQRAGKLSTQVKKSELIRAGIKALAAMSNAEFVLALKLVPAIKTGRPSKD